MNHGPIHRSMVWTSGENTTTNQIMYIYHALINALSAHMIHINLHVIFCTHVEHSPTKTIYIKYYTEKQTILHLQSTERLRVRFFAVQIVTEDEV